LRREPDAHTITLEDRGMGATKSEGPGVEVELKLALSSRDELLAFRNLVGGKAAPPVVQENHFFDSADRVLDRAKHACRLRREGEKLIVTVKGPGKRSQAGLLIERAEEEIEVSAAQAALMLKGQESPLAAFAVRTGRRPAVLADMDRLLEGRSLTILGCFSNLRTRIEALVAIHGQPRALVFELDQTTFPGGKVDYEIEVEVPRGVDAGALRQVIEDLCRRAGITPRRAPGKLERFMKALKAMGGA
jgi:uncharacterized protein YjbK